ncbi:MULTISPECIES: hypothetical protein [Actinoalloteichus]|nr:hypothetical protein [Actinoalloteichus caeruleus]
MSDSHSSLTMHPTTVAAIVRFAEREQVTYSEALRRLVSYGSRMHHVQVNGGQVVLRRPDATEEVLPALTSDAPWPFLDEPRRETG